MCLLDKFQTPTWTFECDSRPRLSDRLSAGPFQQDGSLDDHYPRCHPENETSSDSVTHQPPGNRLSRGFHCCHVCVCQTGMFHCRAPVNSRKTCLCTSNCKQQRNTCRQQRNMRKQQQQRNTCKQQRNTCKQQRNTCKQRNREIRVNNRETHVNNREICVNNRETHVNNRETHVTPEKHM